MSDIERSRVLLGVTGSIAAYKAVELARRLVKRGLTVRVAMTESATEFIAPLTFETITGNSVAVGFWDEKGVEGIEHIDLGAWAEVVVIAPATADTIAKITAGFADNELLASLLVTRAPILIAPAMNTNMYEHPATQENIAKLKSRGIKFIDPEEGDLACGWHGTGRMADPKQIFYHTLRELNPADFAGKKVLVTAGPTREFIDPVRFISNRSSGRMGAALANEAFLRGAEVTLIQGPIDVKLPSPIKRISVENAQEMYETTLRQVFETDLKPDIVIMAAAVADFRPKNYIDQKVKKHTNITEVELVPNPDILKDMGARRGAARNPVLVGFAVETGEFEELSEKVRQKIINKNIDMVVGNLAAEAFETNTNHVLIMDRNNHQEEILTTYKGRIARKIFDSIRRLN